MNSWIFEFRYEGEFDAPVITRFTTSKSTEDPRVLLSVWYFDEYTEKYKDLGHEIVEMKSFWQLNTEDDYIYEANLLTEHNLAEDQKFDIYTASEYINFLKNPNIIDLDKTFCSPPLFNHGCYNELFEEWNKQFRERQKRLASHKDKKAPHPPIK
jgi:hypothetical protein